MMGEEAYKGYPVEDKELSEDEHKKRVDNMLNKYGKGQKPMETRLEDIENKITEMGDHLVMIREHLQRLEQRIRKDTGEE